MKHKYTVKELERLLYEAQEEEQLERLRHIKKYNEAVKSIPTATEGWNKYPPKAVADTVGITHPQKITKSDWAWIYFDALGLWAFFLSLLIFLTLIDY